MTDSRLATHLCLTCKHAEWNKTKSGKLHPDGDGKCGWKMPPVSIPAVYSWHIGMPGVRKPTLSGGYIVRKFLHAHQEPITECECYQKKTEGT